MENCPTCKRVFTKMLDYPEIAVSKIEWGPLSGRVKEIPDQDDSGGYFKPAKTMSEIFADLWSLKTDSGWLFQNYTSRLEEIAESCQDQTVLAEEWKPPFEADECFKWAYRLPPLWNEAKKAYDKYENRYYLAFQEETLGTCKISVYCEGPNMGSAGGPTLLYAGSIMTIHYRGHLPSQ